LEIEEGSGRRGWEGGVCVEFIEWGRFFVLPCAEVCRANVRVSTRCTQFLRWKVNPRRRRALAVITIAVIIAVAAVRILLKAIQSTARFKQLTRGKEQLFSPADFSWRVPDGGQAAARESIRPTNQRRSGRRHWPIRDGLAGAALANLVGHRLLRVDIVDGPEGDGMVVGLAAGPAAGNRVVVVPLVRQHLSLLSLDVGLCEESLAP